MPSERESVRSAKAFATRTLRLRLSLRSLLLAISCLALVFGFVGRWWTQPYALTGTHANGIRAWEQWERRTLTLQLTHIKTVRFYSNGQKGLDSPYEGEQRYWSPDGVPITEDEYHDFLWQDGFIGMEDDQSERPFQAFLWWWNEW